MDAGDRPSPRREPGLGPVPPLDAGMHDTAYFRGPGASSCRALFASRNTLIRRRGPGAETTKWPTAYARHDRAGRAAFSDCEALPQEDRNILWIMFTHAARRQLLMTGEPYRAPSRPSPRRLRAASRLGPAACPGGCPV